MRGCWLVVLILCCALAAQDRPWLATALLDRSDLIALVKWESDRVVSAPVQITAFVVDRVLKGTPCDRVLVGGLGARGSACRDLPKLLFLKGATGSRVHSAVDLIDLTPDDFLPAPYLVEQTLKLLTMNSGIPRDRLCIELAESGLRSNCQFALRCGVREFQRGATTGKAPLDWIHVGLLQRCAKALPAEDHAVVAEARRAVLKAILGPCVGAEASVAEGAERDAFVNSLVRILRAAPAESAQLLRSFVELHGLKCRVALEGLLQAAAPELRREAATWLAEVGSGETPEKLLAVSTVAPAEERRARIESSGKLGGPQDVPRLAALLAQEDTLDAVLIALARCGGAEARTLLEQVLARLEVDSVHAERCKLLRMLLSAEFQETEALRRSGRSGRKRS